MILRRSWPVALAVALGVLAWQAWGQADIVVEGPARVIDGDSLEIDGRPIRLYGIDAPELRQSCWSATREPYPCGEVARVTLRDLLVNVEVYCHGRGIDFYGRLLAVCWNGPSVVHNGRAIPNPYGVWSINATLVDWGYAVRYKDKTDLFWYGELLAQQNRLGLWAGYFELPSDYRKRTRTGERAPTLDELRELMREGRPEA